jgi:hypothetical protein
MPDGPDTDEARPALPVRFTTTFVSDLVDLEVADADPQLRARATDWVVSRVDGAAQPARLGLLLTASLVALGLRVTQRASYASLPDAKRQEVARRVVDSRLPLVSDWVRAMRALALSYYFEAREGFMR